jgi:TctA family transporter
MNLSTDTRTDTCPHCGAEQVTELAQRLRDESDRWDNLDDKCEKLETEVKRLREALYTLTLIVGLTPVAGNKAALIVAYNLARKALNPDKK